MRPLFRFAFVLAFFAARPALSDDREQCLAASSAGQDFRETNKLIEARGQLLACARETCPTVVRRDCAEWLTQVDAALPTVVISLRDDQGTDIVASRVVLDGVPFLDRVDGTAVPMNPGVHKIGIETEGMNPFELEIVIRVAEKNRSLVLTLKRRTSPDSEPVEPAVPSPVPPTSIDVVTPTVLSAVPAEDQGTHSNVFTPRRKVAIGLAAVGGVGLIVGAILGTSAQGKHDDAQGLCPDPLTPCANAAEASASSTSAHNRAIGANVAFGVSSVALIGGAVLWFIGGPDRNASIAVTPQGTGLTVLGRF